MGTKTLWQCRICKSVHYGNDAPVKCPDCEHADTFGSAKKEEVAVFLGKLDKKFWKCTVCNDIHYGKNAPEECPTCFAIEAYVEISLEEFKQGLKE